MDVELDSSKTKRLEEIEELIKKEDKYREKLDDLERKSSDSYDKTLIALSSGALGISFAFVGDFLTAGNILSPEKLFLAWACWATTLTMVLFSFLSSHFSMRVAIEDIDELISRLTNEKKSIKRGESFNGVHSAKGLKAKLSDCLDKITAFLNILSGVIFVVGLFLIFWFVKLNLK